MLRDSHLFKTLNRHGYLNGQRPWNSKPSDPAHTPPHLAQRHKELADWIMQDEHCAAIIKIFRRHK